MGSGGGVRLWCAHLMDVAPADAAASGSGGVDALAAAAAAGEAAAIDEGCELLPQSDSDDGRP